MDWGTVEWGPNPAADLALTLLWLSCSIAALWVHASRWWTDGPVGRRFADETTRMFLLDLPHGMAGSLGWVGTSAGTFVTAGRLLDLAGASQGFASVAAAGAAALITVLTWRSGRSHRWVRPADPPRVQHTHGPPTPSRQGDRSTGSTG